MTLPQRPLRGSRISSFYPVKSLPSLSSLDSAFQLQEYISLLIRLDVHDVEAIVSLPGKKKDGDEGTGKAGEDADADKGGNEINVDEPCWIYEQLRRLAQDLTHPLINMLQQECTRSTCPEMKAGEWLYLCVAHGNEGALEQCCAIDYILHTLDSATALLNTPRAFPSRLQIPTSSHRHFGSLARRLGRIFAHAYFHHREAFEQAEAESSLYARFLALTSKFELVPPEFMVIPPRPAHGSDSDDEDSRSARNPAPPPGVHLASTSAETQAGAADEGQWSSGAGLAPVSIEVGERGNSPLSAGIDSPRKMGRNRTDTMVLNEAHAIAEELAKAGGNGDKKKDVEKDLNSFSLLSKPEPEASTSTQPEADVTSAGKDGLEDVPIIPDQEQQTSPTSEEAELVPEVTPSSSTALPEADLTEVTAVNATPEVSPAPHETEFDKKDTEGGPPPSSTATEESSPPAAEPSLETVAAESTPSPTISAEAEPSTTPGAPPPITTSIPIPEVEAEPTISAADEIPDSPVVPREDIEEVPIFAPSEEVSPPPAEVPPAAAVEEAKVAEGEETIEAGVAKVPEVEEEEVESEMKELVEGKTEEAVTKVAEEEKKAEAGDEKGEDA